MTMAHQLLLSHIYVIEFPRWILNSIISYSLRSEKSKDAAASIIWVPRKGWSSFTAFQKK